MFSPILLQTNTVPSKLNPIWIVVPAQTNTGRDDEIIVIAEAAMALLYRTHNAGPQQLAAFV